MPEIQLVGLSSELARQSAALAAQQRLRGADAVYAAVALQAGTTLISLDREQRERVSIIMRVLTPAEALNELTLA